MERMRVALSRALAIIGMVSLMCVPGILVLIGFNSPRMLAGASGFGSQMSIWLGPPCRKTMMTDFALPKPREPSSLPGTFAGGASAAGNYEHGVLLRGCAMNGFSYRLKPVLPTSVDI